MKNRELHVGDRVLYWYTKYVPERTNLELIEITRVYMTKHGPLYSFVQVDDYNYFGNIFKGYIINLPEQIILE